jgi:hypothetical protein
MVYYGKANDFIPSIQYCSHNPAQLQLSTLHEECKTHSAENNHESGISQHKGGSSTLGSRARACSGTAAGGSARRASGRSLIDSSIHIVRSHDSAIGSTSCVRALSTRRVDAHGLKSSWSSAWDSNRRRAAGAKGLQKEAADGSDIVAGNTKGGSRHANLSDEVSELNGVEVHELVDVVHGSVARICRESRSGATLNHGASKEGTKVGVEMSDEHAVHN